MIACRRLCGVRRVHPHLTRALHSFICSRWPPEGRKTPSSRFLYFQVVGRVRKGLEFIENLNDVAIGPDSVPFASQVQYSAVRVIHPIGWLLSVCCN